MIFDKNTELPKDWSLASIKEIALIMSGQTPKGIENASVENGEIPWFRVGNMNQPGNEKILQISDIKLTHEKVQALKLHIYPKGTILFPKRGGAIATNKKRILGQPSTYDLNLMGILPIVLDNLYFWHWFESIDLKQLSDGSNVPQINHGDIEPLLVPLPPLNEQKRIVGKIEALQKRSQRVKEAIDAIPQLLDQFRQSVLAAAFCGDLTADWRENNPDVDWVNTTLQNVIKDKPRNGYSPKAVDYPTSVKSLTLTATTSGKFKPEHFKYIDENIDEESHLWLEPGDILIQRSNSIDYVGTSAIYTGNFREFMYPDLMMKIQVLEEKATSKFITYALSNIKNCGYFKKNATGTAGNMPKINQKVVMNTPIPLPSVAEQQEIVRQIQSFFKAIDIIKQQYQETKANLDLLNQSILAKAFRGELVPQNPNDEPASILLERIRAEREKLQQQTKAAKKSKGKITKRRSKKAPQKTEEAIQLELPGMEE